MSKGRASHFKKLVCFSLIFIGLFSVLGVYLFSKYLRPTIISVSQKTAENEVSRIIDEEVKRLMLEEFLTYDKITIISRDSGGNVTSVSANSVLINNFANELDICIGNRIDNTDTMKTDIFQVFWEWICFRESGLRCRSGFNRYRLHMRISHINLNSRESIRRCTR